MVIMSIIIIIISIRLGDEFAYDDDVVDCRAQRIAQVPVSP